jgi:hypothetical protein
LADQTEDWDAFENLLYNNGKFNIEEIIHGIVCFRFADLCLDVHLKPWWRPSLTNFLSDLRSDLPHRDYQFLIKIEKKFKDYAEGMRVWNFRYQFRFASLIKEYTVYFDDFFELQKSMCYQGRIINLPKEEREKNRIYYLSIGPNV